MSLIPQLIPLELNSEQITNRVLTTVIKMISERGYLNKNNLNENVNKLIGSQFDDMTYKINLDTPIGVNEDINKLFIIKIINQKITTASSASSIGEFLHQYKQNHKIIIVRLINGKTEQQIKKKYQNTEIFLEKQLMIDIVANVAVPKHVLLSDDESNQVITEYEAKKKELPKILENDPIVRYYNMKIGQICRIIRPSETSGLVPYYRIVTKQHNSDS